MMSIGFVVRESAWLATTAVTRDLQHILDAIADCGLNLVRVFAPEHGVDAGTRHDYRGRRRRCGEGGFAVEHRGVPKPAAALLEDLDVLLFDIQDIGARYYTYQATLGFIMEVAATTGPRWSY